MCYGALSTLYMVFWCWCQRIRWHRCWCRRIRWHICLNAGSPSRAEKAEHKCGLRTGRGLRPSLFRAPEQLVWIDPDRAGDLDKLRHIDAAFAQFHL